MSKMFTMMFNADVESRSVKNAVERVKTAFKASDLKIKPIVDQSAIKEMEKNLKVVENTLTRVKTATTSFTQGGIKYNVSQAEGQKALISQDYSDIISAKKSELSSLYKEAIVWQENLTSATKKGADELQDRYSKSLNAVMDKIRQTESAIKEMGGGTKLTARGEQRKSNLLSMVPAQELAEYDNLYKKSSESLIEYERALSSITKAELRLGQVKREVTSGKREDNVENRNLINLLEERVSAGNRDLSILESSMRGTENLTTAQKKREIATKKVAIAEAEASAQTTKHTTFVEKLGKNVKQAIGYYTGYGLAVKGINMASQALYKGVETVRELNDAMTDVQMVTEQTASETQALAEHYSDLAKELGATTVEIAKGSSEWFDKLDHIKFIELRETP